MSETVRRVLNVSEADCDVRQVLPLLRLDLQFPGGWLVFCSVGCWDAPAQRTPS